MDIFLTKLAIYLLISLGVSACQSSPLPVKTKSRVDAEMTSKEVVKSEVNDQASIEVRDVKSPVIPVSWSKDETFDYCMKQLDQLPGQKADPSELKVICNQVEVMKGCHSVRGQPIFHYDRLSRDKKHEKKILTLALIHGDEGPSGSVARSWIQRLDRLDPRNHWRVIPIANPDGLKENTRVNVNGVDLNRNFPTEDWTQRALKHWRNDKKSDPRKYPGDGPASELETQCLVSHFKEFRPDFIISIHTPYGVLDFDGPRMKFPPFRPLPWISLGNYPGSLGRYMWVNHNVPVLTIELKGSQGINQLESFDRLQDISGTVAIQADKILRATNKK